jgi:glycosyltransferase involved in cell wall biosynthesis
MVNDGPELKGLNTMYPDAWFVGVRHGKKLARYYSTADVLVFPSLTDASGLVRKTMLKCGNPLSPGPFLIYEPVAPQVITDLPEMPGVFLDFGFLIHCKAIFPIPFIQFFGNRIDQVY